MELSRLLPFAVTALVAAAGGFFLGRGTGGPPAGDTKQTVERRVVAPPPAHATVPAVLSTAIMDLVGTEKITAANATAVTYRILTEGDPVRRLTACAVLLESMNAENAAGILEAFREITKKTGRRHGQEWALMLRRFGAVKGGEGVKELLADANDAGMAMEGLAAADPAAAEQAIVEAGGKFDGLKNSWLIGLSVQDPKKALSLAFSGKYNGANGKAVLNQAINSVGVDQAKALLQGALHEASDFIWKEPVFKGAYEELNESLFHKNWILGTPGEMLPWLLEQKDEPYLQTAMVARAVDDNLLAGDPVKVLDFLEAANAGRNGIRGTHHIYETLQQNPAAVANMSDENFARLTKFLHPAPDKQASLADAVEKINPARAAQLRALDP